jgi:DNA (cytosine-5)-methyltransferase 1
VALTKSHQTGAARGAASDGSHRRPLSAVSLFSGAGGLDVGLDATNEFELLACVELDAACCESLERNRDAGLLGQKDTQIIQADLSTFDPLKLLRQVGLRPGELDLLVGGPPCQSFSTAGRRKSVADHRGTLLWDFQRFIHAMRPRFFLMENVRGLLSAAISHRPIAERPNRGGPPLTEQEQPGSVVQLWMEDLLDVDASSPYRVDCFEVNAVNYGAPQLRERVLFIGNRENKVVDFPEPTHGPPENAALNGSGLVPFKTLGDALEGLSEEAPSVLDFSPRKKRYLSMVPPGGNWRSLPPEIAKESMGKAFGSKGGRSGWWRRLSRDLPCPTIVTMPNHASTSMCHPDEVRALSVGECARIQGFPDGWCFVGNVQQQMAQVGNAVPTRLGEVAGQVVAEALSSERLGSNATSKGAVPAESEAKKDEAFRRVYLQSHVRTRQWFKAGKSYVWDGHAGSARYDPGRRKAA